MGRYVDDILQPGERVLYSTTIHGITYVPGLLMWLLAAISLIATRYVLGEGVVLTLLITSAAFGLIGLVLVARAWFRRWTTETDVTSLRVIHKEGFISRSTFEMNLDKVESVDVNQSIPGRIFGWGDVKVQGVGDGEKIIRMIAAPLAFRNHVITRDSA